MNATFVMNNDTDQTTSKKVGLGVKVAWGAGGLADNFIMNCITPHILIMPIYNLVFGLDPVKIGIALSVPRFIDAITDPLMGHISDNTRCRWGRRKPYIFVSAILCAALIPLLWIPPFRTETFLFFYLMAVATLISLVYTAYVVPYTALGYELTSDYDERTKVLAWRMYIGLIGSLVLPWAYRACHLSIFGGDQVKGAVAVSGVAGVLILFTGILPALVGKEEVFGQAQPKTGMVESIGAAFRNKAFRVLIVAYLVIITSLFTCANLGLYLNIYHVFAGDKAAAAAMGGLAGSILALISYISLPLLTWISIRTSKKAAMIVGLLLAVVGTSSNWFTMTPQWPYLQLVSAIISGFGLQGCWLMVSSMTADVCDDDELQTGLRREGLFGAVMSFTLKAALAACAVTAGAVLTLSGYDTSVANETGRVGADVIFKMRLLLVLFQGVPLLCAAGLFWFYPITRERAEQTRQILQLRRANAMICNGNIDEKR